MSLHDRTLEEDATLVVRRRHVEAPTRRRLRLTPPTPKPRITSWILVAALTLVAAFRPIHPMKSWHRTANALQLADRARELLRELR